MFSSRLGRIRKMAALASFLALTIVLPNPLAAASDFPYAWPPIPAGASEGPFLGYQVNIVDSYASGDGISSIQRGATRAPTCNGISDPVCNGDNYRPLGATSGQTYVYGSVGWLVRRVLPPCVAPDDVQDCVEGATISDPTNGIRSLEFKEIIPGNTWPADPVHGLGSGSATSLWTDPLSKDPNAGFAVTVLGNADGNFGATGFPIQSFQSSVAAYRIVTGASYTGVQVIPNSGGGLNILSGASTGCAWTSPGRCGVQTDFPNVESISLTLHVPKSLTGWLYGRLRAPDLKVSSLDQGESRITVSGSPIQVPMVSAFAPAAEANDAVKMLMSCMNECFHGVIGGDVESSSSLAFLEMEAFKPWIKQQAQIMIPTWSFGSSVDSVGNCSANSQGIVGVVTTNATIYQGGPPSFGNASLNYKVWAVHYAPSGEVFRGTYDLVIRSDLARCLYKFSNAPVQAKIEVTTESGSVDVATTTLKETSGWIYLSANNFTFSSPTIRVKLIQDVPVARPSVTPSPTVTMKLQNRKVAITCLKGKVVKKVTGLSPKCPSGYKKK